MPLYVWPSTTRVWAPAKWLEKLGSGSKRWCWSWPLLPPPTGHFQKRKPTCIHDHPWIDFHVYSHMQVCLLIFCIHKHMWMFKCVCNCINTLKWKSEGIHIREHRQQTLQSYVFLLVEDWQDVLEFHFHNIRFSCFYVQFVLCTFSLDYMFVMFKIVQRYIMYIAIYCIEERCCFWGIPIIPSTSTCQPVP